MIFVVDNYDSFTWNLVQALGRLDPEIDVARNDRFEPDAVAQRRPFALVISPGPGRPEDAGRSMEMIGIALRERIPLLGVCLGHQAIGAFCGARVERADPRHGRSSRVTHDGSALYAGLSNPFEGARYHSLVVREEGLPAPLTVHARSDDGLVMGLSHREAPIHGVQFHPESVLTPEGEKLLANFLAVAAAASRPGVPTVSRAAESPR
jgi:anthranilate synthase/aminodeoxychorismate synthase-like glutamine amidotransferase